MKPGDFVLDIVREKPKNRRTIVLIRHSKRDSFDGIPDHLREGVEITPEDGKGIRGIPGRDPSKKPLDLGHSVAYRCRVTAEFIRDAYPLPFRPGSSAANRHFGYGTDRSTKGYVTRNKRNG